MSPFECPLSPTMAINLVIISKVILEWIYTLAKNAFSGFSTVLEKDKFRSNHCIFNKELFLILTQD